MEPDDNTDNKAYAVPLFVCEGGSRCGNKTCLHGVPHEYGSIATPCGRMYCKTIDVVVECVESIQ